MVDLAASCSGSLQSFLRGLVVTDKNIISQVWHHFDLQRAWCVYGCRLAMSAGTGCRRTAVADRGGQQHVPGANLGAGVVCSAWLVRCSGLLAASQLKSRHTRCGPLSIPSHRRLCTSCCLQVGKASAEKPALSLNKERLLREGITTLGAFSKRYIKPVPAPAAKGGESAPAPEVEGAKLADGGPARSKQRRRTAAAAPAVAGSKRWR